MRSTLSQRMWIFRTLHLGHFVSRVSLWPLWLRRIDWSRGWILIWHRLWWLTPTTLQTLEVRAWHCHHHNYLSTITDLHVPWTRCSMMSVSGRKSAQLWLSRLLELSFPPPTVITGQCDNRVYAIRLSFLLLLFPATDFRWWRSIKSHWPHFQSR